MNITKKYSCIVLAGGMSRRMGQDKGSMIIQDKPMLLHILEKLNHKINDVVVVLNNDERIAIYKNLLNSYCPGNIEDNFDYTLEFAEDEIKNKGPISGIMTGLKNIKTNYALVLPCDSPFISIDFIDTMFDLLNDKNNEYSTIKDNIENENKTDNLDAIIPYHKKANKDKLKSNSRFNFNNSKDMPLEIKIQNSEPLHSIYRKDNLKNISKLLEEDNLYVKSFIISLNNSYFVEIDNEILFDKDFKNLNRKEDIEKILSDNY